MPTHGQPRTFRYRATMQWPADNAFPYNIGYVSRARIPVRHYPHRDPWQMTARFRLCSEMTRVVPGPPQWRLDDWRRDVMIVDATPGQSYEQNASDVGLAAPGAHTDGKLWHWADGERLPETGFSTAHLSRPWECVLQRAIHVGPLHWLDRRRPRYARGYEPMPVPDEVRKRLIGPPPDPFRAPHSTTS